MDQATPVRLRLGIVLYQNDEEELTRLWRSLESNRAEPGAPAFDVAWLDNSPDAALADAVARLPSGAYRHAGRNLGFGAAHNVLMAEAFGSGADYYVCVNPDAVLHPACVRELVDAATRAAPAGLVEALQFPDEHPKAYDPATGATSWCSGCVLLVTRDLHARVGGFDEGFFMYCEDVDLSWRARAAGFSTTVAARALVHHFTGHRPPGGSVATMMRQSGARLAAKYGNDAFLRRCQLEYRELTGTDLTPPAEPPASAAMRRVADFGHLFTFAEARW